MAHVYILIDSVGSDVRFKIGVSRNLPKRLAAIRTFNTRFTLHASIEGQFDKCTFIEAYIKRVLKNYVIEGTREWFAVKESLMIRAIATATELWSETMPSRAKATQIRYIEHDGASYYCAQDCTDVLGFAKHTKQSVKDRYQYFMISTAGGNQRLRFLPADIVTLLVTRSHNQKNIEPSMLIKVAIENNKS